MSKWYLAVFEGNNENEYKQFESDAEAVDDLVFGDGLRALEVYECNDNECLTPSRMVFPPAWSAGVRCPRCGGPLFKSYLPEYVHQCFDCDEDFYDFEAAKEDLK